MHGIEMDMTCRDIRSGLRMVRPRYEHWTVALHDDSAGEPHEVAVQRDQSEHVDQCSVKNWEEQPQDLMTWMAGRMRPSALARCPSGTEGGASAASRG